MAIDFKLGTGAGTGVFFSASTYGITDVRTTEFTMGQKQNMVDIPYMDGAKNGSDGKMAMGSVTFSGMIHDTSGAQLEYIGALLASVLSGRSNFYAWTEWAASSGPKYHAMNCSSISVTDLSDEGNWCGSRIGVSITLAIYPPSAY